MSVRRIFVEKKPDYAVKLIYLIILIFVTYKCSVNVLQFLSLYL